MGCQPNPGQPSRWLVCDVSLQDAVVKGWFRTTREPTKGGTHLRVVALTAYEVASAMAYIHSHGIAHLVSCQNTQQHTVCEGVGSVADDVWWACITLRAVPSCLQALPRCLFPCLCCCHGHDTFTISVLRHDSVSLCRRWTWMGG